MVRVYRPNDSGLHLAKLPRRFETEIGALVRNCAEIEVEVTRYIAALSGGTEPLCEVMLGRTAITRRLEIARVMANATSQDAADRHSGIFGAAWVDVNKLRNAVAHGHFIGFDDERRATFLSSDAEHIENTEIIKTTYSCSLEDMRHFVADSKEILRRLKLATPRPASQKKSAQPYLGSHPKGRQKAKSSTKSKHQPQSSHP